MNSNSPTERHKDPGKCFINSLARITISTLLVKCAQGLTNIKEITTNGVTFSSITVGEMSNDRSISPIISAKPPNSNQTRLAFLKPNQSPSLDYINFTRKYYTMELGVFLSKDHLITVERDIQNSSRTWSLHKAMLTKEGVKFEASQSGLPFPDEGKYTKVHLSILEIQESGDRLISIGCGSIQLFRFEKLKGEVFRYPRAGFYSHSDKNIEIDKPILLRTEEGVFIASAFGNKSAGATIGNNIGLYKVNFRGKGDNFGSTMLFSR